MINVLIVDDHAMVRRGLKALLATCSDITVVGEASDGLLALELVGPLHPDIVLMDLRLNGPNGLDVSHQILTNYPDTKIIILTAFDDDESMIQAMQIGASAFLQKSTADEKIIETIRLAYSGKHFIDNSQIDPLIKRFQYLSKAYAQYEYQLKDNDILVLQLMAKGYNSQQIAKDTFWSERTVKRRVSEILQKLNCSNRTEAVAEAIKRGII